MKPRQDNPASARAADAMTPLHKIMGRSPAQIREELVAMGYDPAEQVQALRRLGRVMAAKFAPQIEAERCADARPTLAGYPLFEEAVAAGIPEWVGSSGTSTNSTLIALLGGGDPSRYFWARVSGWSMRDAGIKDGDVVLVSRKGEPKDGDIVLAHLAGQGQLIKRLRIPNRSVAHLESANPDFATIVVDDPTSMTIHGVVVGHAGAM
jgi:SOS-response transcriptional repressor LexA